MPKNRRSFTPEYKDEAAKMVVELSRPVVSVARELGVNEQSLRNWVNSYRKTHADDEPPLDRDFTAAAPGQKMVGDITYIPTWQGWLYLATVIDCHTKEVLGWAMDDNYKTPLISVAITMAARNHTLEPGAIFHSDYAEPCVKPRDRVLACLGSTGQRTSRI